MRKYIIYMVLSVIAAVSCEQLPENVKIYGVGCEISETLLPCDAGTYQLKVYADGDFTAILPEEDTWVRFADAPEQRTLPGNSDMTLALEFDYNRFSKRTAVLRLERGTNVFKFTITQESIIKDGVNLEQKIVSIDSQAGQYSAKMITSADVDKISFETVYPDRKQKDWVSGLCIINNFIAFDAQANTSSEARQAEVVVRYGEWKGSFLIRQCAAGMSIPDKVEISEVKALLDMSGEVTIDAPMMMEGLVINDHSEKNGAANRIVTADVADRTLAEKTLYLQSKDGSAGIKVVFTESCAQMVSRYDRIGIDMTGLVLRREDAPVRYSIENVPLSAMISSVADEAPVQKVRTLAGLNDDDIYTLVTIPDVQIPVGKGSYAPIDIRHVDIVAAYPMVIRDKDGDISHMMVNVDCTWSRNGRRNLPKGSGTLTGVVVHEKCDNFEWDSVKENELVAGGQKPEYITGLGTIGDYQIRPVLEAEVMISEDASESFSTLMYEWGYCDYKGENLAKNYTDDKELYPTYPLVDPLTSQARFYCEKDGQKQALNLVNDFTHVGPYTYGGSVTQKTNGNGIYDYLGRSAHWREYGAANGVIYSKENKQEWDTSNGSAWCVAGWDSSQYWCVEFSTEGLTAQNSPLNITFGTMNKLKTPNAIRDWKVQWSADKLDWKDVTTYTVPDFAVDTDKKVNQLPGTKFITVNIQDEILGLQKAYVRLVPTGQGLDLALYNAINYFAIRYNN